MKLPIKQASLIHRKLELFYEDFALEPNLSKDPIGALDRSLSPQDLELLSFVIAGLSYGRVEQIYKSFYAFLGLLKSFGLDQSGSGLFIFLKEYPGEMLQKESSQIFKKWKHRLNTGDDISRLLGVMSLALKKHGSLENLFVSNNESSMENKLCHFSNELRSFSEIASKKKRSSATWKGTGPQWFFASPSDGSTCKRMLMWLRWMLRQDAVDLGLWEKQSRWREELLWPVDTHIHRWALSEKLSLRKSVNWKFCLELSAIAKQLNPKDPIKYDFAICQAGMAAFRKN